MIPYAVFGGALKCFRKNKMGALQTAGSTDGLDLAHAERHGLHSIHEGGAFI